MHAASCRDSQEHPSQNEREIHPSFLECCINKPKELWVTSPHTGARRAAAFKDYREFSLLDKSHRQFSQAFVQRTKLSKQDQGAAVSVSSPHAWQEACSTSQPASDTRRLYPLCCQGSKSPFTELHQLHGPPALPKTGTQTLWSCCVPAQVLGVS